MDALARILTGGMMASTPGPTDDFWYSNPGQMSASGVRINPEQAETLSAFYRGVWLLSSAVAMLPLFVYRRLSDGGKERAENHPLYELLHDRPNTWQTSFEWRRMMMRHIVLRGNGYNRIVDGPRGFADRLEPIHPDLVTPEQLSSKRILYHVRDEKTNQRATYTQDEIFHLRGVSDDGVTGKSVIGWARDSLGLAKATEGYAARLFSQGAMHGGIITHPGTLNDEASKRMAKSFKDATTGPQNWHQPVVLEQGVTWQAMTMTAEDSQYLLSRKFSVTEMARWLGVPPHKMFDLERSTNNNIEHQSIEWVVDDLMPWLVLWEQAIARDLILATGTYFAEFLVEGLLRGDSQSRAEFYAKLTTIGAINANEIRQREGLNRYDDGDTFYVQGAMRPTNEPYQPASAASAPDDPPKKKTAKTQPAEPADPDARVMAIVQQSAARLLRKEITAIQKMAVRHAADEEAFAGAVTEFYSEHAELVAETLQLPKADADGYCATQAAQVLTGNWLAALAKWKESDYSAGLAALAVEETAA